jgi:hypothetical protein
MYQRIKEEQESSFEIDETYINKDSDTKERLRIVKYQYMKDYVTVYYYKFENTHNIAPWSPNDVEWEVIDQYEKTMTYEDAKSLVIKNRDKKLERILNYD